MKTDPQSLFSYKPRPVRAEWEKTINSLRPWLSPEKFEEAAEIHWRMFERVDSWYTMGANPRRGDKSV